MAKKPTYEELENRVRELEKAEFDRDEIKNEIFNRDNLFETLLDSIPDVRDITSRKQTETVQQENENRYRNLFMNSHAVMMLIDPENAEIVDANPAAVSYYGWCLEELTGKKITDINTATEQDVFHIISISKTKPGNHFICKHRLANGDIRDVEVYSGPIELRGSRLLFSIIHDVTERKLAENALRESREKYSGLFHYSNDAIIIHGIDGAIVDANERASELFGYPKTELCKMAVGNLHPAHAQKKSQWAFEEINLKKVVRLEIDFKKKDGTVFPADVSVSLFEIGDQKVIQGVVRDITARKLFEEKIKRSRNNLQAVFDGISDPMFLLNRSFKVRLLNRAAAKTLFKKEPVDCIGNPCHKLLKELPAPCRGCRVADSLNQEQPLRFERKGLIDSKRTEEVTIYPIQTTNHETGSILIRISDVTETKLLERQLVQNEKMKALGLLVSGIAHEINNPNNFISFNIPILREYVEALLPIIDTYAADDPELEMMNMPYPEFREDLLKILDNIANGSSRIEKTVADLREFSKQRDHRQRVHIDPVRVLESAITLCQGKIRALVKNFEADIPADLPQIYTVPQSIEQVVINLLVNASQSCDKEASWVRLKARVSEPQEEHLVIEVSDNGVGMSEETKLKVFDPFFSTKEYGEGTGLGLYICQNLINRIGGKIEIESELGSGSTFRLLVPI